MYKESQESIQKMIENKKRIDYEFQHPDVYTKGQVVTKAVKEIVTTIRKSGLKRALFKIDCRLHKEKIFDKKITYDTNDLSEINYCCNSDCGDKRIAVYTAIFGEYDVLKEPEYIAPNCDYYIFTDCKVPSESIWKKLDYDHIEEMKGMDSYHLSKFVKIFPNLFFKDYDYSIWVDGATTIIADLYPFIDRLNENPIGMFDNPVHDCIYTEADFLVYYNRVQKDVIKSQISHYRKEGYPKHRGMFECTIIARQHHNDKCVHIMNEWWNQIVTFSMRDQISFPYVLWKENAEDLVTILGKNRNFNPRLRFDKHTKTHTYK